MSGFLEKYNTDEVFLRSLIIGVVRMLNNKVTYLQTNDKQEILEVHLPFFYSLAGDESFLQDSFLDYVICDPDGTSRSFAEGNYDVIPRGVVLFNSVSINPSGLTSKFVRNTYNIEDKTGEMKAYSAYTNNIPLNIEFSVRIKIDTLLDSFKIFQSVMGTFTKVDQFSFEYDGTRIAVQVGFPEQYDNDKQFEFSYGAQQKHIEVSFSIVVETYYPQRDLATERFRGNLMQAGIRVQTDVDGAEPDELSIIN